ncbi:heparinase II/III domain-containing protein [Streptomyces longispororuber]|uniref:heparinase II/III domain-containing protein n=1 Tax=Streptomyces longispororuber TaxID=68230 RepID=UPI00210ACB83|nr:heparinase II/III family protein [Streptomyces longispororuber]MCQ4207047.1 heparinase II/III-family protein [Streptomyces longispororuber]
MAPVNRMIPRERGGWWHAFVCPAHGLELDHGDVLSGVFPEGGALCARGCRVDTPEVRGAWTVLSHQAWARHIRVLALRGEDGTDGTDGTDTEAVRLLLEYADVYRELAAEGHEGAQSWMLRGRLFHQALTDAIWAVNVGHAVWTLALRGAPGTEGLLPLLDELERAALESRHVLVDRGDLASNYTTWLTAAGIATGRAAALVRGTEWDGAKQWLDGPHGLYAQLRACVGGDGWEWEGSTYYHGFVLRAALLALRGVAPADVPSDVAQRLAGMVDVLAAIATDGGVLPALNDGPYLRAPLALEWLELCALAQEFTPSPRLDAVARRARAEAGAADDGLDLLVAGTGWFAGPALPERPAPAPVTVFDEAGYAVVRAAGVQAVLAFGPHGGSHGHRDKLALSLYGAGACWQPDPGEVPYAHAEFRDHYASTAAHPAFRVDGAEQAECAGRLLARDATSVTAEVTDAYQGVRAVRRVEAGACHLVDVLTVVAGDERQVTGQLRPGVALDVQVQPDGAVRTTWYGDDEVLHGWHAASVPVRPVTRPGPGPADDPQLTRSWVDFTATADRFVLVSVYQSAAEGPAVTGVRLAGDEVVVDLADGSRAVHGTGV